LAKVFVQEKYGNFGCKTFLSLRMSTGTSRENVGNHRDGLFYSYFKTLLKALPQPKTKNQEPKSAANQELSRIESEHPGASILHLHRILHQLRSRASRKTPLKHCLHASFIDAKTETEKYG
jgi:hypothetical protein